ncbi:MAG TPA: tetratricopeptide repeat protein [Bdellovibrionota bacterium]|nr:tetratricopeptide repeat protein [Bdellovibrionota bacterium]
MGLRIRLACLVLIGLILPFRAFSSDQDLETGKKLHDAGDYDGAIRIYRQVLKDEPKNEIARYELGFSLYSKGEYRKSIRVLEKLLEDNPEFNPLPYSTLGSAYDGLTKLGDGEKVLREGLDHFSDSSLLHYNLGINLSLQNRTDEATREFIADLRLKPDHSSAWLALAEFQFTQHERHRAFLLFARFLALESDTKRAKSAASRLWALLFLGVSRRPELNKEGKAQIDVTVPPPNPDGTDPQGARDLGMSMVAATRFTEEEKGLSDAEFFTTKFPSVLDILVEQAESKDPDGFWQTLVLNFFSDAKDADVINTMAYLSRKPLGESGVTQWLESHAAEVEKYRQWASSWKPPAN